MANRRSRRAARSAPTPPPAPRRPAVRVDRVAVMAASTGDRDMVPLSDRIEARSGFDFPQPAPLAVSATESEESVQARLAFLAAQEAASRDDVAGAMQAMVVFRKCYAVAYRALQNALAAQEGLPQLTEDALAHAAAFHASVPFSEPALVEELSTQTLLWMATLVKVHLEHDREEDRKARLEEVEARRRQPVNTGLPLGPAGGLVHRESGLVLVGWGAAASYLLTQASRVAAVGDPPARASVVRFALRPSVAQAGLVTVPKNLWEGCCNTNDSLPKVMGRSVFPSLTRPPDLVLCDDVAAAFTASYTGRPAAARAGDAYKRFSRWCSEAGAAFVGVIPVGGEGDPEPDVSGPVFDQLRAFARVVPFSVRRGESGYVATFSDGLGVADLPADDVDAHSSIIMPGGPL